MHKWRKMLEFVGIEIIYIICQISKNKKFFETKIKYKHGCLCSFGTGNTEEEALQNAANRMPIDWYSVSRKITEKEWKKIAHQ